LVVDDINDEKPIQLIDFEGINFKLNQEALDIIRSIDEELIVVSVVGKARTGKSYLMNLLLDNIGKSRGVLYNNLVQS
jgi:ATPase subunit of ABC transporter with duplicated ATPase domains